MRRFSMIVFIVCLSATASLFAQKIPDHFLDRMNMREIGPAVTSGRVTAIDVVPGNPATILAGTASGGLWKSESGGVSWTPVFDKQPVLGIGAVKVSPSNPDVIWVGTGEGNPRNSQTSGKGIFRSGDGGITWVLQGLEQTRTIHRICVHPQRQEVVYAGAPGSAWGPDAHRGVYKTTDSGATWKKVLFVNDSTGCADLVMDPRNSDKLFAAMWQYQREPWFFNSGGKGSGLYMTTDGGNQWKRMGKEEGLPDGKLGRIGLAIAPGNPKVVYALVEGKETALYRSDDGGFKWSMINNTDVGDRPFYYNEIHVDPSNENHLIYLHSVVSESIDGGKTWKTILPYYGVHPDHHAFWWSSENPDFMIEGNDGGLNISYDGGKNWRFASDIPVAQFYHINYDMQTPYNVYGGMQDNGSWRGPGYVWHSDGIIDSDWQEVLFGDGFDVVPDPTDERFVYAMYQGGHLYCADTQTGQEQFIQPVHPDGTSLRFHWNAAIAADPLNPGGIFYGSQFLHYSSDKGMSWKVLSPDLTTNDPDKQKGNKSGGLTIDATSAETFCTILTIAPSALDSAVIWVGTDDGQIQLTRDRGKTWKNFSAIPGMPKGAWVPQIVASLHQAGEAWVVVNNYRRNDWKPYLFHTTDFGKTWKNIVSEPAISGHCLSMVQDHVEPSLLFLGTEHGLYVSIDYGKTWTKWPDTFPSVATQDMKIHPRESDLIIGTFGRAAYILDDLTPLRMLIRDNAVLQQPGLQVCEPQPAVMANYRRHLGGRFPADGRFAGDNKPSGAVITYNLRFNEKQEIAEKKSRIIILNEDGDTIRWFTHKPDTGLNRITWNYERNGIRFPSRQEPGKDEDPPGSFIPVRPGKYKVVVAFDQWKDSTSLTIRYDPRINYPSDALQRQEELYNQWAEQVKLATNGFSQLRDARKTIERVRTNADVLGEKDKKNMLTQCDSLVQKINNLEGEFMLSEDARGIQDDSNLLNSVLWKTISLINTGDLMPAANAASALQALSVKNRAIADRVNAFFDTDWAVFQKLVDSTSMPVFQERRRL
ncbi:MAG: VPS10 domain-containing protein [Flavobacteriales bacterium]